MAEADSDAVFCGLLLAAFMAEGACVTDCEEAAVDMGVSRIESRISLRIF